MSKNRIKFGSGKEVVISKKRHTDHVKAERENKTAEARKNDLHRAGKIYQRFMLALKNTPTRGIDLAGRFMALRDEIKRTVRNRRIRALCLGMVDTAIEKAVAVYGMPPEMPPK